MRPVGDGQPLATDEQVDRLNAPVLFPYPGRALYGEGIGNVKVVMSPLLQCFLMFWIQIGRAHV